MAISLYCYGLSLRAVAAVLFVHYATIHRWIHAFAKKHGENPEPQNKVVAGLGEICDYIRSQKINTGINKRISAQLERLIAGNTAVKIPSLLERSISDGK